MKIPPRLAFLGCGRVMQTFLDLLDAKQDHLAARPRIVAAASRTRGMWFGSDSPALREKLSAGERFGLPFEARTFISSANADILFELTTLDPNSGQPAIQHILWAFEAGMHVITANKGPIAFGYKSLREDARRRSLQFRFEGTVMDGAPIFNLAEYTLPGTRILGFRGILNSTTNFILSEMRRGVSFEEALATAQAMGIAEADPSFDLDGWDAAVKACVLANVLMDADVRPQDVERGSIRSVQTAGHIIRPIVEASSDRIRVGPRQVEPNSVFASIDGTSNILILETDTMGDLAIVETNPQVAQTAYALFSDLARVLESTSPLHSSP